MALIESSLFLTHIKVDQPHESGQLDRDINMEDTTMESIVDVGDNSGETFNAYVDSLIYFWEKVNNAKVEATEMKDAIQDEEFVLVTEVNQAMESLGQDEDGGTVLSSLELGSTQSIDVFFVLINSIIVFLLQGGFAFLEAGLVRSKNTTNIIIKNVCDTMMGAISFWAIGYMFARSGGTSFIGIDYRYRYILTFTLSLIFSRYICLWGVDQMQYIYWFWMFVFCATASTIVSGALAERCQLGAYIIYSLVTSTIIFPIVAHWVWSEEGWLKKQGFIDYAGAGVVHMLGGTIGLVGSFVVGPRIGRFTKTGDVINIPGHSIALSALGFFIIIFSFFSFNAGSNGSISTDQDLIFVQNSIVNTIIGAATSGLTTLTIFKVFRTKKWSLLMMMNGTMTGMVASAAFCNRANPFMTFLVGLLTSVVFTLIKMALLRLKIDDPLDVVPVHFGGGSVGILSVPFVLGKQIKTQIFTN